MCTPRPLGADSVKSDNSVDYEIQLFNAMTQKLES